jgi:hypothetical protein
MPTENISSTTASGPWDPDAKIEKSEEVPKNELSSRTL